jgi:cell shape-determining protein MreD
MTLTQIHGIVSNAFLLFALIVTLWALLLLFRQREISSDFWGAVVIGEVLIVAQVVLGIVLVVQGRMPARWVHFLYGTVTAVTWPSVFAFTKGESGRRAVIYWALSGAFLFGVALRAIGTAAG